MDTLTSKYANLVTVTAVLLAVVYAPGEYDGWDLLIGVIGGSFAIKCFRSSYCEDLFSGWLVGVIACVSLLAVLASTATFFGMRAIANLLDPEGWPTFPIAIGISILALIIGKLAHRKKVVCEVELAID